MSAQQPRMLPLPAAGQLPRRPAHGPRALRVLLVLSLAYFVYLGRPVTPPASR
jgi:hypothetical protein